MTVPPATPDQPTVSRPARGCSAATNAKHTVPKAVRDASIVVVAAVAMGLVSNLVRHKEKLSWIQTTPYDLLVPCPEPVGQAQTIQAGSPLILDRTSLVIDARAATDYAEWHIEHAINVPFDWLGPPVQDDVTRVTQVITRSNAKRVIVYGDGDNPDSGREWARLLSGGGIRNVNFIEGGAPALRILSKELHGEKRQ
jgi:rhodanese-related sulfurtransferase